MDPYEILISPYRYIGLIWGINLLLFFLIFRTIAYSKTAPEWNPATSNLTGKYRKGYVTHKYLVDLSKNNPGKNPFRFVEFVHKEILYNIAYAYTIKINDVLNILSNEEEFRMHFYDEEIRYFLANPIHWMRNYPYQKRVFYFFKVNFISPELKEAIIEMIQKISIVIISRSETNE